MKSSARAGCNLFGFRKIDSFPIYYQLQIADLCSLNEIDKEEPQQVTLQSQLLRVKWYLNWFAILLSIIACTSCSRQQSEIMEKGDFIKVPIFFLSCTDAPLLNAEIEGTTVALKVDLGANCDLMLKDRVLKIIQDKEFKGISQATDVRGNQYQDAQYLIPKINIGNLHIQDAVSGEENIDFLTKGSKLGRWKKRWIDQQLTKIDGRIGTGILLSVHCYFDIPHKALYLAQNLIEIQKCYSSDEFIEVPFELQNGLIFINAVTNFGTKKFLLDTGAGVSIVRKSQFSNTGTDWVTSNLFLSGVDFGQWEFFLYDPTDSLPADGILGIDFFKKCGVHLDFEHQKANIQMPKTNGYKKYSQRETIDEGK